MDFKAINELLMQHVSNMTHGESYLFETDVTNDEMWNTYLSSFPPGMNELFRKRREFDCNCCKHFIKILGSVVRIKDGKLTTIWDFDPKEQRFTVVNHAMSELVSSRPIRNVFFPVSREIGVKKNLDSSMDSSLVWHHFYAVLDKSIKIFKQVDIGTKAGEFTTSKNVFMRSLVEFKKDAIETVLDLISQKSLYKGEEWENVIIEFRKLFDFFHKIKIKKDRELFCWETSMQIGPAISRIKNHSIGVLLQDLSNGEDLNAAVSRYEKIVAPSNYKRPKAIFTQRMVDDAKKTVISLGLENSLGRRYAVLDDITVPNVLFANRDAAKVMTGKDPFSELSVSVSSKQQKFYKLEEVPADRFIADVIPTAQEVEILLENQHGGNMVSLIAPKNLDAPSMFKWNNGFCWAYAGNITDSMKERVKALGGMIDGVLRFSIQWNDNHDNNDDLDAHCIEPSGNEIYFGNKGRIHNSSGKLDVDIINPRSQISDGTAVENIIYTDKSRMPKGVYKFFVHQYTARGAKTGFTSEIEFDGQIYSFSYPRPLRQHENVKVADITLDKNKIFTIKEYLSSQLSSRDIWGLASNTFHPVSVIMYSPNYWDEQMGIGHRHYFFMLKGCINPESPNGFFNEFLPEKLLKHKRVFEALGSQMRVEKTDKQLSGIGFSSTKRASVVVKVKGSFERLIRVVF